jgi:hypothetical protein
VADLVHCTTRRAVVYICQVLFRSIVTVTKRKRMELGLIKKRHYTGYWWKHLLKTLKGDERILVKYIQMEQCQTRAQ